MYSSKSTKRIISQTEESTKNQAAVTLGRLGGLKSVKAKMEKISRERRKEIVKSAAEKRWLAKA